MKKAFFFSVLFLFAFLASFAQGSLIPEPSIPDAYAVDLGTAKAYSPIPVTRGQVERSKLAYAAKCRIHYTENSTDKTLDCHDLYIEEGSGKYFAITFLKTKGIKVVKMTPILDFRLKTALR